MQARLRRISQVAATSAAAVGVVALIDRLAGGIAFLHLRSALLAMKAGTAAAVVALCGALWLDGRGRRRTARVVAVAAMVVGALGHASPTTAVAVALGGAAVLAGDRRLGGQALAPWLATGMLFIGVFATAGYAYGAAEVYELAPLVETSLLTALSLTALGLALALARPDRGWIAMLAADTVGAQLARWLLPTLALVSLGLGWLRLLGEREGLYGREVGVALHAGSTLLMVTALVWWGAARLHAAELERRRLDAHLIAADRLAAVGVLAGGIGHEINNPLAALMMNLDLLAAHRDDAEGAECLADAHTCAERIRAIVADIKLLARPEADGAAPVAVVPLLETALRVAAPELRVAARVVTDLHATPPVLGSEARLGQVVLNLLINAVQAIPPGESDRHEVRLVSRVDGAWVVIEVSDTGVGIAPEHRHRLFDPFFTTKPATGTGLGLSISHRIVTSMGGTIDVESQAERGTTFRIRLPAAG